MRISPDTQKIIKNHFKHLFEGDIYLFGSRVDDTKKGGDIDLYITLGESLSAEDIFERKLKLLSLLQTALGEQKIDIIVSKDKSRLIEQEAIKHGVKL